MEQFWPNALLDSTTDLHSLQHKCDRFRQIIALITEPQLILLNFAKSTAKNKYNIINQPINQSINQSINQ